MTIALPEDVQAEAVEVPDGVPAPSASGTSAARCPRAGPLAAAAVAAIRGAKRPFIVAGGGVLYSGAEDALRALVELTGIPVGTTQAGGGSLDWDHPQYLGGVGATGTTAANRLAAEADLVIGIGTRYSDFTTASRTAFQHPDVAFVNINVAAFDAYKHGTQLPVIADARETLDVPAHDARRGYRVEPALRRARSAGRSANGMPWSTRRSRPPGASCPASARSSVRCRPHPALATSSCRRPGSLPGDLHKLWRVRDALGYHVEYAFSSMGYEIAGGLGVKRGLTAQGDDRDVIVMVGDGSYLMLHTELATAVAEGIKIIVVLIQNQGYASIGHLSETVGSERFGTRYRYLDEAAQLRVRRAAHDRGPRRKRAQLRDRRDRDQAGPGRGQAAVRRGHHGQGQRPCRPSSTSTPIRFVYAPDGEGWWDVPVAEVSSLDSTRQAHADYLEQRQKQRAPAGLTSAGSKHATIGTKKDDDERHRYQHCPPVPGPRRCGSERPRTPGASGSPNIPGRPRGRASSTRFRPRAITGSSSGPTATCPRTRISWKTNSAGANCG